MKWLCSSLECSFSDTICFWHHLLKQSISLTKPFELCRETQNKDSMTQEGASSLKLQMHWISESTMNPKTLQEFLECFVSSLGCCSWMLHLRIPAGTANFRLKPISVYYSNNTNFPFLLVSRQTQSASHTDTRLRYLASVPTDLKQTGYKWRLTKCMQVVIFIFSARNSAKTPC